MWIYLAGELGLDRVASAAVHELFDVLRLIMGQVQELERRSVFDGRLPRAHGVEAVHVASDHFGVDLER